MNGSPTEKRWVWWTHYVVLVTTHDRYHHGIGSSILPSNDPTAALYEAEVTYLHLREIYRPLLRELHPVVLLKGLSELWEIHSVPLPENPSPRDSTWERWVNRFRPLVRQ